MAATDEMSQQWVKETRRLRDPLGELRARATGAGPMQDKMPLRHALEVADDNLRQMANILDNIEMNIGFGENRAVDVTRGGPAPSRPPMSEQIVSITAQTGRLMQRLATLSEHLT